MIVATTIKKRLCVSSMKFLYGVILLCLIFILCPIASNYRPNEIFLYAKNTKTAKSDRAVSKNAITETKEEPVVETKPNEENKENEASKNDYLYNYEEPRVEEESYVWLIFKTILVIGILIGGFYFFFKFITQKVGITAVGQEVITILSVIPLGQNKFLQVVDIAGKVYVLGVSDNNINLITEIKEKDDVDRIRLLSSKSTPAKPGGFQDYLSTQLGKVLTRMKNQKGGMSQHYSYNHEYTSNDNVLLTYKQRLKKLNGDDSV